MAEPIAIVGSACRFPGSASSPSQLWGLLKAPRDVIRDFPVDRFNFSGFYDQDGDRPGCTNVQGQSYLLQEDCRLFDNAFFRINNKEAHSMDPQQRILLETFFETLEAAGWPLEKMEGSSTSVYVGVMTSDYNDIQMRDLESLPTYSATGLARSILANRLSYFFDLKGPSMTIDTACSSSMVALHQAVQGLRNGDAAQAIVAGSTLLLDHATYIAESKLHMLSPDSRSRMWDKGANGYARGEGCAAILLKPLSRAIEDNDDIECIIRESAVNSDGRTQGLTMPNSSAQANLIRQTYEKAGLDSLKDRCQYFECHGTGTLAGDVAEARAIQEAFFPSGADVVPPANKLYCGSIKTVIGHLEGCAGIAGILKGSLAIQNQEIPPNMHFKHLNPAIEPHYANICVPTSLVSWPDTNGKPLRASVNSFGFGGTNAHVILESYQRSSVAMPVDQERGNCESQTNLVGPFVFSAKSHSSLLGSLAQMADHIRRNPSLDLDALSWVLHSRRTGFVLRTAIVASDRQMLLDSLERQLILDEARSDSQGPGYDYHRSKILGVFTGQGAQWACMGRELMVQSPTFRKSLGECEEALRALPDGPSWSLKQELSLEAPLSRISQGEISQPLCVAIQISLVHLLRAAGVHLDAVVGHSSGEVSAAYAAGLLSVRDAMGISYYRGLVAHLAQGDSGQTGAMIAVGMGLEDATAFCSQARFVGRIGVAASNSPSSVTLSGDSNAIHEAEVIFDQDKIFSRLPKVDKAYHSHHMICCAEAYSDLLKSLDVSLQAPQKDCVWYSSVDEHLNSLQGSLESLSGPYWVENMIRPVRFSQALEAVLSQGNSFAIALEVGPHPTLKGSVNETFKRVADASIQYAGCLERGKNDVESMSAILGLLWTHLGPSSVDLDGCRTAFNKPKNPQMPKALPSYCWDHEQIFWHESRLSREYRSSAQRTHELLGRLRQDTQYEMTWRNVFRQKDIPWLRGHRFQGQVVFPGAGYVSMVMQASEAFVRARPVKMLEIQDMNIAKALVIHEDDEGVEIIFTIRSRHNPSKMADDFILQADFTCYSCSDERTLDMCCDGVLVIHLGSSTSGYFPPSPIYVSFQVGFATFASTAEKAMGSTYLPAGIRRAFVDPAQRYRAPSGETSIGIDAHLVKSTSSILELDINLYDETSNASGVRIDGLILKAIAEPQPSDDRQLFAKTFWDVDVACGLPDPSSSEATKEDFQYIDAVERTALFFMQDLCRKIHAEEIAGFKWHHQALFRGINTLLDPIREGRHAIVQKEWLNDTEETIREFANHFQDSVDLALLTVVGENLPSVVRGESEMLEHMLKDDLLGRLYTEGRGFAACNENIAEFMRKISHKHPRIKILEIGAGTGGTTRSVLDAIGSSYLSYTYTDISAGFFEKAARRFADHSPRMDFKTFNVEEDPVDQGFGKGPYDVIIAANVLHATRRLAQTVQHVRSLLRPGGFLLAAEVTGTMLRETGLMGGLEGWWLGVEDGRFPCPGVSAKEWDDILLANGFSGVESIIYDFPDISRHNCSVFITRAFDERLELLNDPLALVGPIPESRVLILGGQTMSVSKVVRQAGKLAKRWTPQITICPNIDALDPSSMISGMSLNDRRLENLQELLGNAANVLWVANGRLVDNPYSNIMIGIGRSLALELPHVEMQFLDFDQHSSWDMEMATRYLLRMVLLSSPQHPEIVVKGGSILIPRLVPDHDLNERLNAKRHFVLVDVELSVALHSHSEKALFLCFGHIHGRPAFALSNTNSSTAIVSTHNSLELSLQCDYNAGSLVVVGSALIASYILSNSPATGTILVHEPLRCIAEALATAAISTRRKLLFIKAMATTGHSNWNVLHPLAPTRVIRALIPDDSSTMWRFSDVHVDNILSNLPNTCVVKTFDPHSLRLAHQDGVIADAIALPTQVEVVPSIIKICDTNVFLDKLNTERLSTVVEWQRTNLLKVIIPPIDLSKIFAADKTYFMVGMASELGQSLCRFMISCGACHIVLASRNANSDAKWPASIRSSSVDVRIVKMDVTDRAQVHETASMIRNTMPEIAGVANGAMVLEDSLFLNTTVASIEKQLKPKIDGIVYLDEEFAQDNLDFFIAFSSLGSEYGNAGQSIYHAANMFMSSLVAKRRRRGQSASVINIGMITDVGYVAKSQRANTEIEQHLRSQFYTSLAETEFHHLFIQAILSGHPNSTNAELTMGMETFVDHPNASARPQWFNNPRFSHMVVSPVSSDGSARRSTSAEQHRKRLELASSTAEVSAAFEELFCKKIESMIKIPLASISIKAPLSDLGLDSLLAVEIRIWLLKDLGLDVPLLEILGRESIWSISSRAASRYIEQRTRSAEMMATSTNSESTVDVTEGDSSTATERSEILESQVGCSQEYDTSDSTSLSSPRIAPSGLSSTLELDYTHTEFVSYPQASLHFLQNFLEDRTAFNVTAQYSIKGQLNVARFSRAIEKTLAFHEAYQTCFFTHPGNSDLHQGITLSGNLKDRFVHVDTATSEDVQLQFQTLVDTEWDLPKGPIFKAVLFTHATEFHTIIFGCHHIIMDGMSWHIFLQDLERGYQLIPFATVPNSYREFSRLQIDALKSGALEDSIGYWMHELDPIPSVLPLFPFSLRRSRQSQPVYRNHTIKDGSQMCRATTMQFYLAVMQALFARLLDIEELCIGVTDAGRGPGGNFSSTIGHFTNLLPMRFRMSKERPFEDLVQDTSRKVLSSLDHAQIPIDVILERLGMPRSSAHTPLFQIAFNYRIGDLLQRKLGNCSLNLVRYVDAKTPYDLTFNITQTTPGAHLIEISSSTYLYSASTTEFIMNTYVNLLESLSLDPLQTLQSCTTCSKLQLERAPSLGRGPRIQHMWPETLTERFQQVCTDYPESLAIKHNQLVMTYAQLSRRVINPSIDTYAAMLGILHVGAIYVPLDPVLPVARQRAIMRVCKPDLLLFHCATTIAVAQCDVGDFVPRLNLSELPISVDETPATVALDHSDAFLLFTSGSTGTPKGVRLTQSGVMNYAASKSAFLGLGQVTVLQQSSIGFDMSIAQAFNAFANAGTLVVASSECRGDPMMIARLMMENSVHFTICTPSEYLMLATYAPDLLRACSSWRYACSGGEPVADGLVSAFQRLEIPGLTLTNCYGPTEVSCAVTLRSLPVQDESSMPYSVGKAIPNTSVYILGDSCEALPIGFPGEIYIGGRGVARGYLDIELKSTKFLPDPFATPEDVSQGWGFMYKTGDRGCLLEDGSLVLSGRIEGDTLIKLRGFRIELNEVANAILQASKGVLSDAIVTVRGQPEFLVAHIVLASGKNQTQAELDRLCACLLLPQYMIPAMIIAIDHLPTTINGKIDRRAMSEFALPTRNREYGDDSNLTIAEGELRLIWKDILGDAAGAAHIRADTDFFVIGGSSLLLVRLQSALKERMGIGIPLHELYRCSTLRAMAAVTNEERGRLVTQTIDWELETSIDPVPEHVLAANGSTNPVLTLRNQRRIVLTGATGFLGSEILTVLMDDNEVATIYCIAVPADARHRIPVDPKVVVHTGSLSSPNLGLSRSEMAILEGNIDQIIHADSQGHCLNNYASLRDANYLSTRFLTTMALPYRVPIHFISSPRVILQSGTYTSPSISMAACPPPTDGSQGFTSSKWASECFLEKMANKTSLPVVIHRPCSVIGARAPHDDAMNAVIRYSILSRTVPDLPNIEGFFDFKDVATVAADIVRCPVPAAGISFKHHSSGVQVPFSQLARRMENLYGGKFALVSMAEWILTAIELGIEDLIVRYLEANIAGGGKLVFPYMGESL
ncbi:lovastatin nonaketide synthase [Mollisia scopiformis]|uniref:Lovastatin nonaketide synthase n=1 Tax=Mollisia scopiformis TaxID=149040 RepID=A0A132B9D8_MOLSC|nr:lovastatin nonaketide synthase [Mollisia scopiformis]KUJ09018.1 lovastatin nonaketide synthase [Mollisia scopiformis]